MRLLVALGTAAVTLLLVAPGRADQTKGADIFKSKCAMCHGADGKGQTPVGKSMQLKDLTSDDIQNLHDSELKNIIENGKGKMKAFKGTLTTPQIEDVVQYLRSLKKK